MPLLIQAPNHLLHQASKAATRSTLFDAAQTCRYCQESSRFLDSEAQAALGCVSGHLRIQTIVELIVLTSVSRSSTVEEF